MADPVEDRGDDFVPNDNPPGEQAPEVVETNGKAAQKAVARAELEEQVAKTEPEAKAEGEPEADPEEEDEKAKGKKDSRIPLARHKAVIEKERATRAALEAKLAQYEKGQQVSTVNQNITAAETQLTDLSEKYNAALADGELKNAAALMGQIRTIERNIIEARSDMKIAAMQAQAVEQGRFEVAVERIEAAYPVLNPEDDAYDSEQSQDVLDLMQTYQTKGMTPTAAMQKAVKKLLGAPETAKQNEAVTVTPRAPAAPEKGAERKAEAVKKATDAVQRTPPSLNKVGMDSDAAGGILTADRVLKMDQREFSKLGEKDLAKLRGDVLA